MLISIIVHQPHVGKFWIEQCNDDANPILIYGIFILPLISDTNLLSTLHIYMLAIYSNYKVGWQMLWAAIESI